MNIQKELEKLSDEKYRDFQSKLMPTVPKEKVLGIRMPVLKSFAKSLTGTKEAEKFLNTLPHKYYDEYNLHALLIDHIKDFDKLIENIKGFDEKSYTENVEKLICEFRYVDDANSSERIAKYILNELK